MDMYTLLYLKWINNKDLLCSTWNSVQCYMTALIGGLFEGEWIHVYIWLGLPRGASDKESACQCRRLKKREFNP